MHIPRAPGIRTRTDMTTVARMFMDKSTIIISQRKCSRTAPLVGQIHTSVCGLKLHENWGTTPAAIDACLRAADKFDVRVSVHTDTITEAGYLEATLKAINGWATHTYRTEGAGGGHTPDIIRMHHSRTFCRRRPIPRELI